MWEELGVNGGTAIIVLIAFYFIIKWGVKNGIKEAYKEISGEKKRGTNDLDEILETEVTEKENEEEIQ